MNIENIDKDMESIVVYLNENGFEPYASCDGVAEHHNNLQSSRKAYLSMLESDKIIDVMTAFLRDKNEFEVVIGNDNAITPYYLYNNLISGNTYSIYFDNINGEKTNYFERIIKGTIEENITISNEEKGKLNSINQALKDTKESELHFSVYLNTLYQPHMNKSGKINKILITTKENDRYYKKLDKLSEKLSNLCNLVQKKDELSETYNENEFVLLSCDNNTCEIYLKDENINKLVDIIKFSQLYEHELENTEIREIDYEMEQ